MKKMFLILAAVMLFSVASFGAAVPCGTTSVLFTTLGVDGCYDGDKLYENFGTDSIALQALFQDIVASNTHIVTVAPATAGNTWLATANFWYDVTVLQQGQCTDCLWGVVTGLLDATMGGSGTATITKTFTGSDPDGEQIIITGPRGSGVVNSASFHVNVLIDNVTPGGVVNVTDQYIEGAIPEPVTMALFGSGLLALGLVRRFRRS
jgi:hypothetical protein